ncbi:MAG: DUF4412 domain-containing protein [Prolixibacteraceae bacterium]|nr:DUF4412 domain-containing protein [Prolixibacteraceae bacterium]
MKKIVILFVLLFSISSLAEAQILRRLARSAQDKAEEKVEDKAEEEVDKQVSNFFDKLLEEEAEEKEESEEVEETDETEDMPRTQKSMSNLMNAMGVSTEDVERKEVYRFNGQIVMIAEGTEEDGTKIDPVEYTVNYNNDNSDIMFKFQDQEGKNAVMIMDMENNVTLILSNDGEEKSGLATKIDVDEENAEASDVEADEEEDVDKDCLKKTGNKRNINGYSCREYRCENSEEAYSVWVTDEFNRKNNRIFKKTPMGTFFTGDSEIDGMVIQYDYRSKVDKSTSKMTVEDIDTNKSSSFSTKDYEIVSFGMKVNN